MSLFYTQDELSQEEGLESVSQEVAMPSVSQEVGGPIVNQEVGRISVIQEVAGPSRSLTQSQVPPLCLTTKRPRKGTITEEKALGLIREASDVLRSPPDTEEAYGCYLATRLQKLEEGQCFLCEGIFGEALQKGLRGQLTENSHVYELDHPPSLPLPPPPATSAPPEPQPPRKAAGTAVGNGCMEAWREGCSEEKKVMAWVQSGLGEDAGLCSTTAWGHRYHLLLVLISGSPGPDWAPNYMDFSS
ncbi:hypothetical protein AB205_0009510 [Aquarana catesbeiana]|uniref:Uncharacterized protein n=1 Tax=Aquarana catesbeiana TaxID=8400 RepID=A0A2G9QCG0_AQUCT|nr:hypothetical protein AB205_0009510 [Aquarana catesbeiana]